MDKHQHHLQHLLIEPVVPKAVGTQVLSMNCGKRMKKNVMNNIKEESF